MVSFIGGACVNRNRVRWDGSEIGWAFIDEGMDHVDKLVTDGSREGRNVMVACLRYECRRKVSQEERHSW